MPQLPFHLSRLVSLRQELSALDNSQTMKGASTNKPKSTHTNHSNPSPELNQFMQDRPTKQQRKSKFLTHRELSIIKTKTTNIKLILKCKLLLLRTTWTMLLTFKKIILLKPLIKFRNSPPFRQSRDSMKSWKSQNLAKRRRKWRKIFKLWMPNHNLWLLNR